ncbi:DUF6188 family protein [Nocardia sp. NPDC003963]
MASRAQLGNTHCDRSGWYISNSERMARLIIPMPGRPVELVQLVPVLILRVGTAFEVQIESSVGLRISGDNVHRYPIGEIPEEVGPQLSGALRAAHVADNGTLQLEFESGSTLQAFADPDYEAWNIVGAHGFRVACMPGGELAVWSASGS